MPRRHLSPNLLRNICGDLQNYPLLPRRARIVAAEVTSLNDAIRNAAEQLRFEDEPASFRVVLRSVTRRR
jgi:hypothetical protein